MRWSVVLTAVLALMLAPGSAASLPSLNPQNLSEGSCFNAAAANADYEAYGPTDVNAQAGDGLLTVGENAAGTITVFKYPNPSYYNQVKYLTINRDAHGVPQVQYPNEGSFVGLRYQSAAGTGFAWLRDWPATQSYDSDDSAVPVTVYRSPSALGITVTALDVAVPGTSAFEREFVVARTPSSPVQAAQLVYYENFNPIASRLTYLPIADWCLSQFSDQRATYDAGHAAIVNSWSGTDMASARATSVAVAFAWDGADSSHQVGRDGYDPAALPAGPDDPYLELQAAPYALGGATDALGQTAGALATDLHFDAHGVATARMSIAAAPDPAGALAAVDAARAQPFAAQMATEARDWHAWLSAMKLPDSTDQRIVQVAKRSLITLRLAIVPESGAIVASADTQGPYGEDWIRDGSFLNEVLDLNGQTQAVTTHNLFYARVQTSASNPSSLRPNGNWAMMSYGDGIDGGPIPYEIDETGLGAWTLWDHAAHLEGTARARYLGAVYPAIALAADYMTQCVDPQTGLQCSASEDDNYTPSESLHGAETVWLGLRSAIAAAAALDDRSARVAGWQARFAGLDAAIAALYDPATHSYGEGNSAGNAYNSYGDGGWLLWPVQFRPYGDGTMQGEAGAVQAAMDASLASSQGEYEAKTLLGLAHAWSRPSATQNKELHGVLSYMAATLTTPTGLFGEAWQRLYQNHPQPVQDMPHVWEHSLFYLAAVQIDGGRPYGFQTGDFLAQACATGAAPVGLCPHAGVTAGGACALPALSFRIHQGNGRVTRVVVYVNGRRVKVVRARRVRRISIATPKSRAYTVRIVDFTASGLQVTTTRRVVGCRKGPPRTVVRHTSHA